MPGSTTTPGVWTLALSCPYVLPSAYRTTSAPELRVFIAVGTRVTPRPLLRSVRAQLRHTVLTLSG